MGAMSELFDQIDSLRQAEGKAALATLVSTHGTTPRKEGAKMWVGEDGRILGSVTIGGCVDAEVMAEAEDVLSGARPKLLSLDLGDEDAWEIGLTCGGTIEVFLEPVALGSGLAKDGALALYETLRSHVATGGSGALLTRMEPPDAGAKLLLLDDGRRVGSLGDAALDAAAPAAAHGPLGTGVSRTVGLGPGEAVKVFVEVHLPPPTLLVVGGSHVAMPLVTLARSLGYRTVVVDGRPRLATRARFPDVDELLVGIPSEIVRGIPLRPTTALVLVAHDYKYDLPVLRHALSGEVGYVGMLGEPPAGGCDPPHAARGRNPGDVARADPGPHRPRPRRQDGARDRAGDPGRDRRVALRGHGPPARARQAGPAGLGRLRRRRPRSRRHRIPAREGPRPRPVRRERRAPGRLGAGARRPRRIGWAPGTQGGTPGSRRRRPARRRSREEVHLLEVEPGDLHEDPAGERVARAVGGAGVSIRDSASGQWSIVAAHRGLSGWRRRPSRRSTPRGMSVYTLFDGQVVDAGEVVARAKVTPLVIAEGVVREVEERSRRDGGCVAVRPSSRGPWARSPRASHAPGPHTVRGDAPREARLVRGQAGGVAYPEAETRAIGQAIEDSIAAGARIVVVAGANALDPLDPVFTAIERIGGRLLRAGVPAHPGSLLWVARAGSVPILGMPGCGMFSQATLFDLLLPRLLAGETVEPEDLAAYGHGGLLGREMAFRFPPYRAGRDRGDAPGVAAPDFQVILFTVSDA